MSLGVPAMRFDFGLKLAVTLVLLASVACSSGDEQPSVLLSSTVEPVKSVKPATTSTIAPIESATAVHPTVEISGTHEATVESPTQHPTSESAGQLSGMAVSDVDIAKCRIGGEIAKTITGTSEQGTAPAPTPTPLPADGSRDISLIRSELSNLYPKLDPILISLNRHNVAFKSFWAETGTVDEQAGQLHTFGNLLSQLCSAISLVDVPYEVTGELVGVAEALRVRHAWMNVALEELLCCESAHTEFLDVGRRATGKLVESSAENVRAAIDGYLNQPIVSTDRLVENSRFQMSILTATDAVVVRNGLDILISIPDEADVLDPASLGAGRWLFGSALHIKRLRNNLPVTVEEAAESYAGIINRDGGAVPADSLDVQGVDTISYKLSVLGEDWDESISIFVSNGFTYFIEIKCRNDIADQCESVVRTAKSIKLAE